MTLTSWLFADHPFFVDLQQHLLRVIETRNIRDLDVEMTPANAIYERCRR